LKIIGLTGGIGSGKTTVAKMFEALGIPVYYADGEARKLMQDSDGLREEIIKLLGEKAYNNDGLNRPYIAQIVFRDKTKLNELNALVHPLVENHFKNWVKLQDSRYVVQENALIFENRKQPFFDAVITVTAPLQKRLERVIKRDGITEQQVIERIENQLNDEFKIERATFVIHNTTLDKCRDQVNLIHKQLLA